MKYTLILLILIISLEEVLSQPIYFDKKEKREYYVYRDSNPELIEDYLKSMDAEAIEFSPYDDTFLLKDKKTSKWNLYSDLSEKMTNRGYDSMGFVTPDVPYTIVKIGNKYGILKSPFKYDKAESEVSAIFYGIKNVEKDGQTYMIARRSRKWAQIDWFTGVNYTPYIYLNFREIDFKEFNREELEFIKAIRRKKGFDYVEFDRMNNNEIFRARSRRLGKWGLYKGFDVNTTETLIPSEFDSLYMFPNENNFTVAFKAGKVAIYTMLNYQVKKISDPVYDDFKRVNNNDMDYLAVKKQGRWGWVDWFDGEIKVNSISTSFEELPAPDWKPKYYLQK